MCGVGVGSSMHELVLNNLNTNDRLSKIAIKSAEFRRKAQARASSIHVMLLHVALVSQRKKWDLKTSELTTKNLFALSWSLEVLWLIMASFRLYVVDKYAWDLYMENAN